MGGFDASLRVAGDAQPIEARLEIDAGRLRLRAADQMIGDWPIKDLDFHRIGQGFRAIIEGEEVLLDIADPHSFEHALGLNQPPAPKRDFDRLNRTLVAILSRVDRTLAGAEKRYGPLLPRWVFTRRMAGLLALGMVLMLVFPGVASTVLLAVGFTTVVFGAVVYTDNSLAAKVLPGRTTAVHVLIAGVAIVVLGFLVAVIAR